MPLCVVARASGGAWPASANPPTAPRRKTFPPEEPEIYSFIRSFIYLFILFISLFLSLFSYLFVCLFLHLMAP